jgi:hypothetical protein
VRRAWVAAFVAAHAQADLTGIGEKEIALRGEAITFEREMVPFTQACGATSRGILWRTSSGPRCSTRSIRACEHGVDRWSLLATSSSHPGPFN